MGPVSTDEKLPDRSASTIRPTDPRCFPRWNWSPVRKRRRIANALGVEQNGGRYRVGCRSEELGERIAKIKREKCSEPRSLF